MHSLPILSLFVISIATLQLADDLTLCDELLPNVTVVPSRTASSIDFDSHFHSARSSGQSKTEEDTKEEPEWEFEPRIWSSEYELELSDQSEDDDALDNTQLPPGEKYNGTTGGQPSSSSTTGGSAAWLGGPNDNPRKQHHFLEATNIVLKQQQQATTETKQEDCTQFKLDTRETIICDKKRCDKFDFEWPKHDNQLVLIQTTRHGMRFHRVDLAFASPPVAATTRAGAGRIVSSSSSSSPTNQATLATKNDETRDAKFDIFELFKPKPTTTTTTPTTTTTSTTAPSTSSSSPAPNSTEPTPATNSTRNVAHGGTNTTSLVSTIRLDTRRLKQKIVGFGGALSDATCRNIKSLSAQMAKSLMEDYFGDRGLRYNIARLSIGSSDFSTTPYTNNDLPPTNNKQQQQQQRPRQHLQPPTFREDDVEMNNFRLTEEDYDFKLPVARQAKATSRREVKFFASLWSPPVWMKNNSNIVHGYLKGDVYGPYYKALAELIIKWLDAYRRNGIEFWATTGLNEPITGVKPFIFHNSLGITRDDYVIFLKLYLGPMLRQRGFQNVKLIMLDDNKGYAPNWVKASLDDQETAKYISGIGVHWYMNDEYENLNFISKYYPDKFILATEACNGYLPFQVHVLPGNWERGVAYAYDIIKTLQKNSVGWVDWNMALDLMGGPNWSKNYVDSPVIVNAKRDEYYKSPMFYAIGHFSRFLEPGSIRLDHRVANARFDYPFEVVAFHTPDNHIVIVALNANKHPVPLRIIVDRQLVRVATLRADSFNTIVFRWKSKVS